MYDVTIVGAGPVGLYATYYAGLRDCKTKLIEMYPQVGGRLISMYAEKEIFDVAGHVKILARDLAPPFDLERHGIHYFLPPFEPFRGKKVLVMGGGNSAVDWALSLEGIAAEVTLAHRMYKFQAHEAMGDRPPSQ